MATVLVGVLLLVSAVIAIFILYRFRKSQDSQARKQKRWLNVKKKYIQFQCFEWLEIKV